MKGSGFDVPSTYGEATPHELRYHDGYATAILHVASRDNHVIELLKANEKS